MVVSIDDCVVCPCLVPPLLVAVTATFRQAGASRVSRLGSGARQMAGTVRLRLGLVHRYTEEKSQQSVGGGLSKLSFVCVCVCRMSRRRANS